MCDCAEEQERRRRGAAAGDASSSGSGWWAWLSGPSDGAQQWFSVIGSTAALMGLLALLYKSSDKIKKLIWKPRVCEHKTVKREKPPEKVKLCICKDKSRAY